MLNNVLANFAKTRNTAPTLFTPLFARLIRKVYAEGDVKDKEGEETQVLNFEDLITKARQEEKNKLYPQIEDLKKKNKVLTEANNEHLLTIAGFDEQVKKFKEQLTNTNQGDPQEVVELKNQLSDTLKIVDGLRDELKTKPEGTTEELRQTIEAEVKASYEVKLYRIQKLQEAGDDILMPELVVGETKEEVDASIRVAIERSNDIRSKLGVKTGNEGEEQKPSPKPEKKPKPNPANPVGRGTDMFNNLDAKTIAEMTHEEYAEWRKKVGLGQKR